MVHTILAVLLIGTLNSVFCENVNITKNLTSSVDSTDTLIGTKEDVHPMNIEEPSFNETEKVISTTIGKKTKQEIQDILGAFDKKLHETKSEDLAIPALLVENANKDVIQGVSSRAGLLPPEELFQIYSRPTGFEFPVETSPLTPYNLHRIADSRRGTFSVFDSLTPDHTVSIPVRQILEGPINIAVPLINHEIALYFVNRGLKSVKFSPSLLPISEALYRPVRKVGLTIPAAFSLRSRYLSWPVKSVMFAESVFLADISNTATYPTILFVPEDEFEVTRRTPDVFRIGDFALLEEGIRYAVPSTKQVI